MPNDVDVSSYPKVSPQSPLDIAKNFGSIEQQGLAINQAKMQQAREAVQSLTNGLSSLGPDASADEYKKVARDVAELHKVPTDTIHIYDNMVDQSFAKTGSGREFWQRMINMGQSANDQAQTRVGPLISTDTGSGTAYSRAPLFGQPTPQMNVDRQVGPGERILDTDPNSPTYNQPVLIGRQAPAQITYPNSPNRLGTMPPNVAALQAPAQAVPTPMARPRLPIAPQGSFGDTVTPNMIPQGALRPGETVKSVQVEPASTGRYPVGMVPGKSEAMTAAGTGSGAQLSRLRENAGNFQADVFPLIKAIPALEELGTKGTGPGTQTINDIKSFILSNLPGVKESDVTSVKNYDEAKKYLTQIASSAGSRSADALAAAFAGNPSVNISNAAAQDVAKSALALRYMQQAVYQQLESEGLSGKENEFSRLYAQRINNTDPRAFGVAYMSDDALTKLNEKLKRNPAEQKRFNDSLSLAKSMGFANPSNTSQ